MLQLADLLKRRAAGAARQRRRAAGGDGGRRAAAARGGARRAGRAAGHTLGAAAILTGYNLGRMEKLPHTEDFSHEFVMAREHRNGYDHAVRAAGVTLRRSRLSGNRGRRRRAPSRSVGV
jgi:hypothetical protein